MSTNETLGRILDSGRKVSVYADSLALTNAQEAAEVRAKFNTICERALAIYFYEDKSPTEFQALLSEVEALTEDSSQPTYQHQSCA